MLKFWKSKKKTNIVLIFLLLVSFIQGVVIAELYNSKDDKVYEVNLVKINHEKDSIDHLELKTSLAIVDQTVRNLDAFLKSKNISDLRIERLAKDSLSNQVYLAKASNRYSQYLVNLEQKLQQVPLGVPAPGYISSNFGLRKNPIPTKEAKIERNLPNVVEDKDSLGNVVRRQAAIKESPNASSNAPAEADQIKFHKGVDIASPYGSEVKCAAAGKVIFAGVKGGYGNCVIVSHQNGLATLYAHLSEILVSANEVVKVGQIIAKTGNTGRSTGPHLHYEVHKNNQPVNPRLFLNF